MTLYFYQVSDTPLFNTPYLPPSHNIYLPKIPQSTFVLSPYIRPEPPYPIPPASVPILDRHAKNHHRYADLQALNLPQTRDFLLSYQAFKQPVFGTQNPTAITNPFYQWVVTHNLSAWEIEQYIIDGHRPSEQPIAQPIWCQARMGQTRTLLPDGRIVLIGGEFEDSYDPNFCIYNDVTVICPSGAIAVYTYPKTVFAPTDFHTATLVGENIIIIGALGYPEDRQYSHTPVYHLDTRSFQIAPVATRNSMGWVHGHQAQLKDNRIVVTGGEVVMDDMTPLLHNLDTWVLNLHTLIWKNMTHLARKWQHFYVKRQDNEYLHLWEYAQLAEAIERQDHARAQQYTKLIEDGTGKTPNIAMYQQLLVPPIDHEVASTMDNVNTASHDETVLYIDGIKIRYQCEYDDCIQVIIEGKLLDDKLELLQQNLRHKLSKIEHMACDVVDVWL